VVAVRRRALKGNRRYGDWTNSLNTLRALSQLKYNADGYLIALECFIGKE